MGKSTPAPVMFEVRHGDELWRVYRTSRHGYEVVVEHPGPHGGDYKLQVWVSGHRWLWRAKRRARRGGW